MKKLSVVLLTILFLTIGAYGADDAPCVYSAKQEGGTVTVRLNAPKGGLLWIGVYDAQTLQMRSVKSKGVGAGEKAQTATVRFDREISGAEFVKAVFVEENSFSLLCGAMTAIIPVGELDFVLNANTMKFHYASCPSAGTISARNRRDYRGTRESVVSMGYEPCNNCRP
ncbi:MAG: hypothetical protein IKO14_04640 [Oscillibacter sp.]|nr:hypothetical protein [Oscillibacter sp.]